MKYPVIIHKDEDSDFGASFPDLPGCVSAGATIEETLANAVEAAELYIEDILLEGEEIPQAGTIDRYFDHPDYKGGVFWSSIALDLTKLSGKTKRVNITVPERILSTIDVHAEARNQSRSAFLVSAALQTIYS